MPVLSSSSYHAPFWLPGGHLQTLYPPLFRKVNPIFFKRERTELPDGDFMDVDWFTEVPRPKALLILSHGLEGNSRRKYIMGLCRAAAAAGRHCAARNFRACGGGMNRLPGMYHSGQTDDLHSLILLGLERGYRRIELAGFSMGGNQTLKYLGEDPGRVPPEVSGAVVFSVPCDLVGCAERLDEPSNRIYMAYFLKSLREKIRAKHKQYPKLYPLEGLAAVRTFREFDTRWTAPVFGFASAEDYWKKASCLPFLPSVRVKTLLVNAANDPLLSPSCFPHEAAQANAALSLEVPATGGHVGFVSGGGGGLYWSERRAVSFLNSI